jgi:glycosyltransferase involved in cell wall biosynthesis
MKILVLSNKVPYPARDGSTIAIKSIIDGLLQNQAKVCLIALNTYKHFVPEAEAQKQKPKNLELLCFNANTNITASGAFKNLLKAQEAYHVSRFFNNEVARAIIQKLKSQSFDVIQLEGLSMAVYLPIIKTYTNKPVVLRAHNIEHQIWERHVKHENNPLKKTYLKLQTKRLKNFENYAFKKVDGIAFITEVDQQLAFNAGYQGQAVVLPCGVNLKDYQVSPDPPRYDLVYLASFDWLPNRQGMEWFIEKVWPLIQKERPKTTLALGGRNMPKHFNGFKKKKVFLFKEVESAQEFMSKGTVVVVPLLAGSGMRIKIIENLALQKPIVATPLAAEGISVTHQQNISLAQKPEHFAQEVLNLLHYPQKRKNMAEQAQDLIKIQYTNTALGQKLLQFYSQL